MRPAFITFDGIDGSGKSTHIETAMNWIRERGKRCAFSREPGGTKLGERIRDLLLEVNQDPVLDMSPMTEALLLFAARKEHLRLVVEPALARGEWVVLDRFTDATYAYQCAGRGLDPAIVRELENSVQGNLRPDRTFIFDLPVEVSMERVARSRNKDRFELEDKEFFEKVRRGYLERAREHPGRHVVLDTSRPIEVVRDELVARLEELDREISSS